MKIQKSQYQYSFYVLLIWGLANVYYIPADGSLAKLFLNAHVYLSLLFIPFSQFRLLKFEVGKTAAFLFYLILGYGLFSIIRDVDKGQILSLIGNPYYAPSFIVPIFLLLSTKGDILFWLNKASLLAVKVGIFTIPFVYIFDIDWPRVAFIPTFFLLFNLDYVEKKDRYWIILSIILGVVVFFYDDYRSGIIRILATILIFFIIKINVRVLYKYVIILLLAIPLYGVSIGVLYDRSFFDEVASIGTESTKEIVQDTRTFLYTETISDLLNTNNIIFGKGPMGTYYSDFFYEYSGENGDYYIRPGVEVGILAYMLRGGIVYTLLITIFMLYAMTFALRHANNRYLIYLSAVTAANFAISFIENIPSYSFLFALFWIIFGICITKKFNSLNDDQIKLLIQTKTKLVFLPSNSAYWKS